MKLYEPGQPRQYGIMLLGIAVVAIAIFGFRAGWTDLRRSIASHELAAARADMQRLQVPSAYRQVTANCRWYRCYVIAAPSYRVANSVESVLTSTGAKPFDADTHLPPISTGPNTTLKLTGCNTVSSPKVGKLTDCTFTGDLHRQPVTVFLHPFFTASASAMQPGRSEVDVAFDGPGPGSSK